MKKKERKVRKHVYVKTSTAKYLTAQAKKFDASLGDIIDDLVEEKRNAR